MKRRYSYTGPSRLTLTGTQGQAMRKDAFWYASRSTVALGPGVMLDLAKAPHVLVAGTTGSGKSVMLNAMICSLLAKNNPWTARLLLIDPKRVEFHAYRDHPMLWKPVVMDDDEALDALEDAVEEMERRFRKMEREGHKIWKGAKLYIFIDELADLMLTAGKHAERLLTRLCQKGRAAGIHCILATQQPTVKVLPGIIKANCPTRIALKVRTNSDSRVILDHKGAETLRGSGDAILSDVTGEETRFQGGYMSDREIERFAHDYEYKRQSLWSALWS